MSTQQIEAMEPQSDSLAVKIAVLTEKVNQVIGDHERRISALEQRQATGGTRLASLIAPFIAGAALMVVLAGKINWV